MADIPPHWSQYFNDEGKAYYYNTQTGVTQWEKPLGGSFHAPLRDNSDAVSPFAASFGITSLATVPATGDMDSGKFKFRDADRQQNQDESQSLTADNTTGGSSRGLVCCCVDIMYLQSFCNVTTSDVVRRMAAAILPFKSLRADSDTHGWRQPDAYGPFWITTTVVLLVFVTANIDTLLGNAGRQTDYVFFVVVAGVVYGCLIGVPILISLLLYAMTRNSSSPFSNFRLLASLYGYSFIVFVPIAFLCLVPLQLVKWLAISIGWAISVAFIWRNLKKDVDESIPNQQYIALAMICAVQLVLFSAFGLNIFQTHSRESHRLAPGN